MEVRILSDSQALLQTQESINRNKVVGASNNLPGLNVVFDGIIRCGKSAQIVEEIKEKLFPEIERLAS